MSQSAIKQSIEQNRAEISALLSGDHSFKRLNSLNWIRHELTTEAETLFQYPDYLPKNEKNLYIDYNNLKNLGEAWDYIIAHSNIDIIDDFQIRKVHSILAKNTHIPGGIYRVSSAFVEQLGVHAPNFSKLPYGLNDIQYHLDNKDIPVLTRAFNTHYDLIALQPFNDFNKRTARLIMNWFLIKNAYRPILFNKSSDKNDYMHALRNRADDDCKSYSAYMYSCMLRTQNSLLKILRGSHTI